MPINDQILNDISPISHEKVEPFSLEQLENKIELLKTLCERLNPYAPIPESLKNKLRKLGLQDLIDERYDPFALTNKLILLMEDAIEELEHHKRNRNAL